MKLETIKLTNLTPDPNNARQHDEKNLKAIEGSLSQFGQRKPIVIDQANVIVAGNGTVEAAKRLGWTDIQAVRVPADWDADRIKAFALADNRSAELANWSPQVLQVQLEQLTAAGFDIEEFGFELVNPLVDIDSIEEDDIPEDAPTRTSSGDIWQLGRHRLMCGDSLDLKSVSKLMDSKIADMAFTDPPYGIDFESEAGAKIQNDNLNQKQLAEFNTQWQNVIFKFCKEDAFLLAWASPRLFHLLDFDGPWKFFRLLTMYKSNRISFPHGAWINKTEPCLVFTKGKPEISKENYLDDCYVYKHDKESHQDSNVGHPTPKPVKMIVEHIRACTKTEQLVIDLFGGSGSTLMACEQTGRICHMMELDPKYCDVIIQRWENLTGKKAELVNG